MTKQELAKMARLMYDLKSSCEHLYGCVGCSAYNEKVCIAKLINGEIPMKWNIKEEDVLRLEREATKQELWEKLGSIFKNYDIPCEKCPAFKSIRCDKSCEQALKAIYEQYKQLENETK